MIYQNEYLNEISFPLGGIGTGSIGLGGNGTFLDWEIFNRPNKGTINPYTFFIIKAEYPDGHSTIKMLQGDTATHLTGLYGRSNFSNFGFGPRTETMCGFPHFRSVVFDGAFPIATLTFTDPDFPATIILEAYNPFIPQDSKNSSLPTALFRIRIQSREAGIRYTVIFSAQNPFERTLNHSIKEERLSMVKMEHAECGKDTKEYGDLTIAAMGEETFSQTYWYRVSWMGKEGATTFWREINEGTLTDREYTEPYRRDVGSVGSSVTLEAGKEATLRFSLSWNVPNYAHYWKSTNSMDTEGVTWKNYYATLFEDSVATARYAMAREDEFYRKTKTFCDLLHGATLDPAILDAISATLSVLKSPTVIRLTDGTFWGWEGVNITEGSCEGTCTHVWSYAYALCFLFPDLERSIRETEFRYDTDENGRMAFRTALPLDAPRNPFRACLDGQMASVVKTYREWKISGDDEWLKANWQTVKALLAYAWSDKNPDLWDRDRDGILEGRQHHTLDMELFGPSAWLEGMYLCALRAGEEMASYLGDQESADQYRTLFEKGAAFTKEQLFNGEYFIQKINLKDHSYIDLFDSPEYWNGERNELNYQIAEGCEIDQLLGQWHAAICGLGDLFDPDQRKIALANMYRYLYKSSMRNFPNAWRVFAANDEGGAVMCDYPKKVYRPVLPIPYSDECMTGFEYAFAGMLIKDGFEEEGLTVIRSIRDRYDGKKRNPWNEIECGSNYARPMASFALLPIYAGMEFDLPHGHVGFSPIHEGDFRCPWSLGSAWGGFERTETGATITICDGTLTLRSLTLGGIGRIRVLIADGKDIAFTQIGDTLTFDSVDIRTSLEAIR
ncbi:MAG: hypothetical protein IKA76_03765 [Clostridia bacterium]|nr:hypothetical protein [Clostridia bacterium]